MSCFLQALSSPVCPEAPDASPCFLSLSIASRVSTSAFQTFEQHWITSVHSCPPLCFAAWLLDDLLWGALRAKQPEPRAPSLHFNGATPQLPLLHFGAWMKDLIEKEACSLNKQANKKPTNHWPQDKSLLPYHGIGGLPRTSRPVQEPHLLPFLSVTSAPSPHRGHDR